MKLTIASPPALRLGRVVTFVVAFMGAAGVCSPAMAQYSPGVPGGILGGNFQLNEHPQMQFAASAKDEKYQPADKAARRKSVDGDLNGCNVKCPPGQ